MRCPDEAIFHRLPAGQLPPDEEAALLEHASTCTSCSRQLAASRRLWTLLGRWPADVADADLTSAVLRRIAEEAAVRPPRLLPRWLSNLPMPLRAAASLVLALGLGVGAGQLVARHRQRAAPLPPVTAEQAAESLGLTYLGGESSIGLADELGALLNATRGNQP